ncbi:MAG: hypothetical protein ACYCPT_12950 [Acidimicrobiales bacterium]
MDKITGIAIILVLIIIIIAVGAGAYMMSSYGSTKKAVVKNNTVSNNKHSSYQLTGYHLATSGNSMTPGKTLSLKEYLQSSNGKYILAMTPYGLMLREVKGTVGTTGLTTKLIWTIPSNSQLVANGSCFKLEFNTDGNIYLYNNANKVLWNLRFTKNNAVAELKLQSDGKLVVLNSSGTVVWTYGSGTKL